MNWVSFRMQYPRSIQFKANRKWTPFELCHSLSLEFVNLIRPYFSMLVDASNGWITFVYIDTLSMVCTFTSKSHWNCLLIENDNLRCTVQYSTVKSVWVCARQKHFNLDTVDVIPIWKRTQKYSSWLQCTRSVNALQHCNTFCMLPFISQFTTTIFLLIFAPWIQKIQWILNRTGNIHLCPRIQSTRTYLCRGSNSNWSWALKWMRHKHGINKKKKEFNVLIRQAWMW